MTPASPEPVLPLPQLDQTALIEAWASTAQDFLALARSLDDDQWEVLTACPGWTVGDVVAHIAAVDADLLGDPQPAHEPNWSTLPHVGDSAFSHYTEVGVDARRGWSREHVLADLADVLDRCLRRYRSGGAEASDEVRGPMGSTRSLAEMLRMRTFDTWVHEQDIRSVLHLPGNQGTPGAQVTARVLTSALPMVVGKRLGAGPGTSLRLVVTGPVGFDGTIAVDEAGRAGFITPAVDEVPTAQVEMDWMTLVGLGCGRVPVDSARGAVSIAGDATLGERLLPAISIAP